MFATRSCSCPGRAVRTGARPTRRSPRRRSPSMSRSTCATSSAVGTRRDHPVGRTRARTTWPRRRSGPRGVRGRGSRPSASSSMWSWLATPSTCSNSSAWRLRMARVHLEQGDRVVLRVPEVLDVEGDAVEADLPHDPPGQLDHALGHDVGERRGVLVAQEAGAVRHGDRVDDAVDVHLALEAVTLDRHLPPDHRLLDKAGAATDAGQLGRKLQLTENRRRKRRRYAGFRVRSERRRRRAVAGSSTR